MKQLYNLISADKPLFVSEKQKNALRQAISTLPEDQQKLLDLHYTKQLTIKEIAQHLQCSVTTAYNRLHRALFILKNQFNPIEFEKAYRILYPESGKPITIASSIVSEYDPESNQSIV